MMNGAHDEDDDNFNDHTRASTNDNFLRTSQGPNMSQYDENGNYIGNYEEDVFRQGRGGGGGGGDDDKNDEKEDYNENGERNWTEYDDDEEGLEEEYGDVVPPMPISRSEERKKFMDIMETTTTTSSGEGSRFDSVRSLGDRAEYDEDDHIYAGIADDDDDDEDVGVFNTTGGEKRRSRAQSMKQSIQRRVTLKPVTSSSIRGNGDNSSSRCCWKQWNHPYIRKNRKKVVCLSILAILLIGALIGTFVSLRINNDKLREENKEKEAAIEAAAATGDDATNPAEFDGNIRVPNRNIPSSSPSTSPTWSPTAYSTLWPTPSVA